MLSEKHINLDCAEVTVLILIVVEHALGDIFAAILTDIVLILIVVEHALGANESKEPERPAGLNPYCGGTCSRRGRSCGLGN